MQDYVLAEQIAPSSTTCGGGAAVIGNPCLLFSNFTDPTGTFGNVRRNSFEGPGYFDTDFSVEKAFGIPKWGSAQFSAGARFFNFFNHPNFSYPTSNVDNPQFGTITSTVSAPTSIYGSGLGANDPSSSTVTLSFPPAPGGNGCPSD